MAFSFHRKGYVENGKDHVTSAGFKMDGYGNSELVNRMYNTPVKSPKTANTSLQGIPLPKPRKVVVKEQPQLKPIVTKKEEDEEEKEWYKSFLSWVKGFLKYD